MTHFALESVPSFGHDAGEIGRVNTTRLVCRGLQSQMLWRLGELPPCDILCLADVNVWQGDRVTFLKRMELMAEGTIKRLMDKGFGFIDTGNGGDIFFHHSCVEGATFEELQEGQRVSYNEGQGPKGPRAENVRPA